MVWVIHNLHNCQKIQPIKYCSSRTPYKPCNVITNFLGTKMFHVNVHYLLLVDSVTDQQTSAQNLYPNWHWNQNHCLTDPPRNSQVTRLSILGPVLSHPLFLFCQDLMTLVAITISKFPFFSSACHVWCTDDHQNLKKHIKKITLLERSNILYKQIQ